MRRRTVLRRTGALAALGLAGCLGDDERTGSPDDASPDPGNGTDAPTDTPAPDVSVANATLSVTGSGPADGNPAGADVAFDTDENVIRVTGTIEGSDGCKTAVLEDATYDPETDTLSVAVRTTDREGTSDQACPEVLVYVEYEAAFAFEGDLPGSVEVSHDGHGVTGAGYDEASARAEGSTTASPTPEPTPELVDTSFEVLGQGPGRNRETADIEFDTETNTVAVTGTIEGSDGCKTAALGAVSYDPATDSVSIDVVTQNREGTEGQACTQALVYIDYRVVVEFAGGLPHEASVSHDGDGIAGGAWASSSASGSASGSASASDGSDDS